MGELFNQERATELYGKEMAREAAKEAEKATTIKNLKSIMLNAKVSAEKAMDILNIPMDMRSQYLALL
ncbi:MAG: hypothetical protein SO119_04370 [Phascolarctobacterium sp.]|nr:hypothetical protein [Phascolarctobacterium sp.]